VCRPCHAKAASSMVSGTVLSQDVLIAEIQRIDQCKHSLLRLMTSNRRLQDVRHLDTSRMGHTASDQRCRCVRDLRVGTRRSYQQTFAVLTLSAGISAACKIFSGTGLPVAFSGPGVQDKHCFCFNVRPVVFKDVPPSSVDGYQHGRAADHCLIVVMLHLGYRFSLT
jgi:hypothetical protein